MIAPGTYIARAVSAELGETKAGNPQIAVEFDTGTDGRITWFGYFTEKAQERTLQALRYCGWCGIDLTDLSGIDRNDVELVVEHESYEGKTRAKVQWVNKLGGIGLKSKMSPDKAAAFAARMKGAILAFDQKSPIDKSNPPF